MSPKTQRYILGGLLVVLAIITLVNWRTPELQIVLGSDTRAQRLEVENPSLRLELLEKIRKQEYSGTHRNIFNASLPPPPEPPRKVDVQPAPTGPIVPPPPPELVVPFKFYGFSSEASGRKRAFFTNGDDIWIVSEGENIQNRFKLLRIGNTTAEVEEIASGRRKTLPLDDTAAPQG